ncbi:DUF871 domain-containing protein [Bacillus massilinigeriensis]|uniref:DUF871 domain-containing protein n=1 Tax=Bacillus mediterraneensis TaxID=1805474 RepID=UPI0008F896E2|nr:MupG family TIM beta-alpha barrel fold protein [Bacillus mediterraneensis]
MLGISVYLSETMEKQEAYIRKMRGAGCKSIFTSLHIPEDDPGMYKSRLQELGGLAREIGMELMADISRKSLEHLGCTWETAGKLLNWGLSGLRIDYGVADEVIVQLSHEMRVALNASTLTEAGLDSLRKFGLITENAEAWHNFYPRRETGLDRNFFRRQNRLIKEAGLGVMAFIPGDAMLRGPLHEGLPTLEDHRSQSPFAAYVDLLECEGVDKVLVGDIQISDDTLEQFAMYQDGVVLLRARAATVPAVDTVPVPAAAAASVPAAASASVPAAASVPGETDGGLSTGRAGGLSSSLPAKDGSNLSGNLLSDNERIPFGRMLLKVGTVHTNRPDAARDVIRSLESRLYATIGPGGVVPDNTTERRAGSITVDNERYGRYQGEIQIAKRDLPRDERVNVIGSVIDADLPLLPFIGGGQKFKIEWV